MAKKKSAAQKAAAAAAAAATGGAPASTNAAAASGSAQSSSAAASSSSGTPAAAAQSSDAATSASAADAEARATSRRATMPAASAGVGSAEADAAAADDADAAAAAAAEEDAQPQVVFLLIEAPSGKSVKVETTPHDAVLDVRQFLLDCPETAEYTCYHLEASFGILNDYLELAAYPQLQEGGANGKDMPVLRIVPELYDERASRLHVRRLRELLVKPPAHIQPSATQAGYEDVVAAEEDAKALAVSSKGKKSSKKGSKKDADDPFAEFAASSAPGSSLAAYTDNFSLHSFHAASRARAAEQAQSSLVDTVRNLSFSGWNPPPGNRALQGDLLYLEIITHEGVQVHVTANQEGFFVNQSTSTHFNPERAQPDYKSLTLVELLKKLSPLFKNKFTQACQRKITQHPFEATELSGSNPHSHHWLAQAKPHTYDWNRSEDALLSTFGMDNRGAARDWNEEYQSCRELPKSTTAERVLRDRTMFRVYSDFQEAATKGAVAVVHGHIPPVNPMDAPRSYVFIYNSIFFSFAIEGRELDEQAAVAGPAGAVGADVKVSRLMANQDLHGVRAYTELDIDELHTLATVLVDYRGHRVIAQSIIPGIFHGDRASKHVYGSMNHGEQVEAKPEFHAHMLKAAEKLHVKPHSVIDGKGQAVELATCVESKGIVGSDGRNYVLDLLRVFPRDANFLAPKSEAASAASAESKDEEKKAVAASSGSSSIHSYLLRPELVNYFARTQAFEQLFPDQSTPEAKAAKEVEDAARKAVIKARVEEKIAAAAAADPAAVAPTDEQREAMMTAEMSTEMESLYNAALYAHKFNPDALTDSKLAGSAEDIAADEAELLKLSTYLKRDLLQKLLTGLRNLDMSPVDTQHLTHLLHENGINMRYLSSIITLAQNLHLPHIENMAILECITRSCKHIFNRFLRAVTPEKASSVLANSKHVNSTENLTFAPLIAKFLTSLFGLNALGHGLSADQMAAAETIVRAQIAEDARARKEYNAAIAANAAAQAGVAPEEEKEAAEAAEAEAVSASAAKAESEPVQLVRDMVIRLPDGSRAPTDPLSPANLWQLIRITVQEKFGYELPLYLPITARSKLCMLRSFCLKTGVQLLCRDYDLAPNSKNSVPFTVSDILDIFPVVKSHLPGSQDARDLLESGAAFLAQRQFGAAYQLLSESLNVHHQVFGPMHVDTANVYATLALTCYHAQESLQAIDFQQRAVIIYERVLGLDSYETAHAHMHQSLFLLSAGQLTASMKHISRALYLFELIAGPNHPDTAAAHMNLAMILQESGRTQEGLKHVEAALERNQLALGPEHVQVALSHHAVAVAHALVGEFRSSVMHEKMAKSIYLAAHGNRHASVVRSHYWHEHFTALAVQTEVLQKKLLGDGKKGSKKHAPDAAAIAQAQRLLSPASIIPPQMPMNSPLTWVSLHSSSAIKGRGISATDMVQLLDATAREEAARAQFKKKMEAEAAAATAAAAATPAITDGAAATEAAAPAAAAAAAPAVEAKSA